MLRLKCINKKKMLKISKKEVRTKEFHGQRQITDIFTIDLNKVVVSDKVSCNNGKECRFTVGYQVDGDNDTTIYQDT